MAFIPAAYGLKAVPPPTGRFIHHWVSVTSNETQLKRIAPVPRPSCFYSREGLTLKPANTIRLARCKMSTGSLPYGLKPRHASPLGPRPRGLRRAKARFCQWMPSAGVGWALTASSTSSPSVISASVVTRGISRRITLSYSPALISRSPPAAPGTLRPVPCAVWPAAEARWGQLGGDVLRCFATGNAPL
jgi:hypothetical protein